MGRSAATSVTGVTHRRFRPSRLVLLGPPEGARVRGHGDGSSPQRPRHRSGRRLAQCLEEQGHDARSVSPWPARSSAARSPPERDDKTGLATPPSIDFERLAGRAQSRGGHSFDLQIVCRRHAEALNNDAGIATPGREARKRGPAPSNEGWRQAVREARSAGGGSRQIRRIAARRSGCWSSEQSMAECLTRSKKKPESLSKARSAAAFASLKVCASPCAIGALRR
jgi:hypothetical protein